LTIVSLIFFSTVFSVLLELRLPQLEKKNSSRSLVVTLWRAAAREGASKAPSPPRAQGFEYDPRVWDGSSTPTVRCGVKAKAPPPPRAHCHMLDSFRGLIDSFHSCERVHLKASQTHKIFDRGIVGD